MTNAWAVQLGNELVGRRLGCRHDDRLIDATSAIVRSSFSNPLITDRPALAINARVRWTPIRRAIAGTVSILNGRLES